MSAILWTDVTGTFPNDTLLLNLPVVAQTDVLAYVNTVLSVEFFGGDGTKLRLARIYFAAHMGYTEALRGQAGTITGPLIGESLGFATRNYASTIVGLRATSHASTNYGQLFDDLVRSSPMRIGVTT